MIEEFKACVLSENYQDLVLMDIELSGGLGGISIPLNKETILIKESSIEVCGDIDLHLELKEENAAVNIKECESVFVFKTKYGEVRFGFEPSH